MFRWRRRRDDDFADEVRSHIELEEARLVERGVAPEEARRRARVAFGSATTARERFREASRWHWLETLWQDIRYGARLLRRSPTFALTAVVVLSLGIGINTALFSVINSLFFRDLHVSRVEELVYLAWKTQSGEVVGALNPADALFFREVGGEVADFTSHQVEVPGTVRVADEDIRTVGEVVEANYFDLLGVRAEIGRTFRAEEGEPSTTDMSVVVGHDFWVRYLASDPNVVGMPITINTKVFRLIGVAPEGFNGLSSPFRPSQWWVTGAQATGVVMQDGQIARLKPEVSIGQFGALVAAKAPALIRGNWERWSRAQPEEGFAIRPVPPFEQYRNQSFHVYSVADVGNPRQPEAQIVPTQVLAATVAVTGLVLFIACANGVGLLLARGVARTGEIAVRHALGAGGARLIRQVLTESLLLSMLAAGVGACLTVALVRLFVAVTPASIGSSVTVDIRVLVFAVGAGLATGLVVGVAPARQAARAHTMQALGSGVAGARRTGRSIGRWIVGLQVALSVVLLIVAGVHVRSLWQIESRDIGYRTAGTIALQVSRSSRNPWRPRALPPERGDTSPQDRAFARAVTAAAAGASGVDQFAVTEFIPLRLPMSGKPVIEQEAGQRSAPSPVSAVELPVSDGYFSVMGMRLLAGRTFDERDRPYESFGERVAVVSVSVAKAFGGLDIVGRRIAVASEASGNTAWLEVVGVVNDVDPLLNDGRPHPIVYEPLKQQWRPDPMYVLVRGQGDTFIGSAKRAVAGSDTLAEVTAVRSLDDIAAEILYPRRLAAGILAGAALIGLTLACIGLYGIVSYSVTQRVKEFGIRSTLGATSRSILMLALTDGAKVVASGLVAGACLAAMALRASRSVIAGMPVFDGLIFVTVPLALVLVAGAACLGPALRASRVDPSVVLRGE